MTFFFGLHLILGVNWTSEDVKIFFLVFIGIFSGNGNRKLRSPPFQICGHAPATPITFIPNNTPTTNFRLALCYKEAPRFFTGIHLRD